MIAEAPLMETDELRAQLEQLHASSFGWALACCRRDRSDAEEVLQIAYLKVLEERLASTDQLHSRPGCLL